MEKIVIKQNNELELNKYVDRFLGYIDVTENTINTYKIGLKSFVEYLYLNNINKPEREDIVAYREHLKTYLKPNTVNCYLIALRNFYAWLEYEQITKDITKKIKGIKLEKRHLKRGLSIEEVNKVLSVCKDNREKLLVKLMITCGLRVNEVVNIQLQDFYDDKGTIMLKVLGKGRGGIKQDAVKIDNRVFELIQEYVDEYNIKDYLFVSTSNNNKSGKLTTKTIRYIITNLFKKANLDMNMLSPHSTRHTTCEWSLESGMELREVSQFMRHKNINTTLVYSKEIEARKSTIANQLADALF